MRLQTLVKQPNRIERGADRNPRPFAKPGILMVETGHDSDEALMARVRQGDHRAYAVLVRRHTNMFFAAAYRMCSNRESAEDIVQEAFLKLWQKPEAWN